MPMQKKSKAHETDHVLKHEQEFKAKSRRNKLIGLWAAAKMGMDNAAANSYAKEVVIIDLDEPGDDDVVSKLMADLAKSNTGVTEKQLREEIETQFEVARRQIESENGQ